MHAPLHLSMMTGSEPPAVTSENLGSEPVAKHASPDTPIVTAAEEASRTAPESLTDRASHEKSGDEEGDTREYPGLATVIPITICLCLCVFIVALDRLIIATAIPRCARTTLVDFQRDPGHS